MLELLVLPIVADKEVIKEEVEEATEEVSEEAAEERGRLLPVVGFDGTICQNKRVHIVRRRRPSHPIHSQRARVRAPRPRRSRR